MTEATRRGTISSVRAIVSLGILWPFGVLGCGEEPSSSVGPTTPGSGGSAGVGGLAGSGGTGGAASTGGAGGAGGGVVLPGQLGTPTTVAQGSKPALDVSALGEPHVVYEGLDNGGIWYAARFDGETQFSTPVMLSDFGHDPRVFVDEHGEVHVVWSRGSGAGATEGWYTNNVGGTWKSAVRVSTIAQGGGDRVMLGRVLEVLSEETAIAVFSTGGQNIVLAALGNLSASTPTVELRVTRSGFWVPDLISTADGTGFETVAHTFKGGAKVTRFDLQLVAHESVVVASGISNGECGSGFRTPDGVGHYTGAPVGDSVEADPDFVWYTNDTRIANGEPAIVGAQVTPGDGDNVWSEICVDSTGRPYLMHDSQLEAGLFVSYLDGESLVLQLVDGDYDGVTKLTSRYGPMCGPTASVGVQVVYPVGNDILLRTVGAP